MAYAFIICSEKGDVLNQKSMVLAGSSSEKAKRQGVIAGLMEADSMRADDVVVATDSRLVVDCMMGRYCIKKPQFLRMSEDLLNLLGRFKRFSFQSVSGNHPMMRRTSEMMAEALKRR